MLQPKTRSMCECMSTSDHDVCSWQKKAAGVACNPADLLQVQQRAAGRLPRGICRGRGEARCLLFGCALTSIARTRHQLHGEEILSVETAT